MNLIEQTDNDIKEIIKKIDNLCLKNSQKVLEAFIENRVDYHHFNQTDGYGYNDDGRDVIEKVYATIFKAEDALVRTQIISGTHALTVTLFGLLRPNDTLLSITGTPYDTLHEVIGIKENKSSLKSFSINYEEIDLIDNDFDYKKIEKTLKEKTIKVIEIQRSKGYSTRKSITIEKLEKVIKFIKSIDEKVIIMVDNCYCELVNEKEPIEVGADIAVGSLIKNLGGGLAPNGGYVVGKKELISLISERLTVPGCGKEVGPTLGVNKSILQGLYMAPSAVASALKTAVFTARILELKGYQVEPKYDEERADIVQNIIFEDPNKLIDYCKQIQYNSPIDSSATVEPWDMPGYDDKVIMAAGTFTQGSSLELSCDGPIRKPYIAYQQGSLTYEYGKLAIINAIKNLK